MAEPETARRFRRAAAFLIHWQNKAGGEGEVAILREVDDANDEDGMSMAAFVCALAELAWRMAQAPDQEDAERYIREVASQAALDEVGVPDV